MEPEQMMDNILGFGTIHPVKTIKMKYLAGVDSALKTYLRVSLVFWYLLACMRYRALPWNYFQLNSIFFNEKKRIFSKLDMDALIPAHLRLKQYYYEPDKLPKSYPVFVKPEWGQNSNGIIRVHNKKEYRAFQGVAGTTDMPFIVQDAASGKKEFEIYYLRAPDNRDNYSFLSITEVTNKCQKHYPINSVRNPCTGYADITKTFSAEELQAIWVFIRKIGGFRMARVGLKADDVKEMLRGNFHIVEINLFLPMPLVLLAQNIDFYEKKKIIKTTMSLAAKLVKNIPRNETGKRIFFQKMKAHYKVIQ
jgi:hypothetical protein